MPVWVSRTCNSHVDGLATDRSSVLIIGKHGEQPRPCWTSQKLKNVGNEDEQYTTFLPIVGRSLQTRSLRIATLGVSTLFNVDLELTALDWDHDSSFLNLLVCTQMSGKIFCGDKFLTKNLP